MQQVIEAEFRQQTIIAVLHRFKFIDRYDRVAVLKSGRLVELDSPEALLGNDSVFRRSRPPTTRGLDRFFRYREEEARMFSRTYRDN